MFRRSRPLRLLAGLALGLVASVHAIAWGRALLSEKNEWSSFAPSGDGYESYSLWLTALGRQYLRREARLALQSAFAERRRAEPRRSFGLGETGWRRGGKLWPHASHQRGLSADIFPPLADARGAPVLLSHQPWNAWGYCQHFDAAGQYASVAPRWAERGRDYFVLLAIGKLREPYPARIGRPRWSRRLMDPHGSGRDLRAH